jgi:hypothetical protein
LLRCRRGPLVALTSNYCSAAKSDTFRALRTCRRPAGAQVRGLMTRELFKWPLRIANGETTTFGRA